MEPILSLGKAEVFFDGIFTEPRLRHPEGIAVDEAGNVWCREKKERYIASEPTDRV